MIYKTCFKGKSNWDLDFEISNEASAAHGCGATFKGQFWYFGDDKKVSLCSFSQCSVGHEKFLGLCYR